MSEMLYDQLGRIAARTNPKIWDSLFSGAVVYDLTNVVEPMGTWSEHYKCMVPKMPPHDRMFCEWTSSMTDNDGPATIRTGLLLERHDSTIFRDSLTSPNGSPLPWKPTNFFVGLVFHRMENIQKNAILRQRYKQGAIVQRFGAWRIALDDDGSNLGCAHDTLRSVEQAMDFSRNLLSLDVMTIENESEGDHCHKPTSIWPAFMAFALLHCKNIAEETIDAPHTPKKFRERGYPPFCSYKVLRIEVPAKAHASQSVDDLGDDIDKRHVRFHLCRGHFKHMKHERFKNRGGWYWVPAHWKGAKELGTVVKDYKLVGRDGGA